MAAILTVEDGTSVAVDAAAGRSEPAALYGVENGQFSEDDLCPTARKVNSEYISHRL